MICCQCHQTITGYSEPWTYPPDGRRICGACLQALTSDVLTLMAAVPEDQRGADESEDA